MLNDWLSINNLTARLEIQTHKHRTWKQPKKYICSTIMLCNHLNYSRPLLFSLFDRLRRFQSSTSPLGFLKLLLFGNCCWSPWSVLGDFLGYWDSDTTSDCFLLLSPLASDSGSSTFEHSAPSVEDPFFLRHTNRKSGQCKYCIFSNTAHN